MVSKLPLIIILYLFPKRETVHQHPQDLFVPVCGCTTVAIIVTFPSRPPSSSCSSPNYPCLRLALLKSHLSGVALNVVPCAYWRQTELASGLHTWGKQGGRWRSRKEIGGRAGEREIAMESYNRMHFLREEWTLDFTCQGLKHHPWKGKKSVWLFLRVTCDALHLHIKWERRRKF